MEQATCAQIVKKKSCGTCPLAVSYLFINCPFYFGRCLDLVTGGDQSPQPAEVNGMLSV